MTENEIRILQRLLQFSTIVSVTTIPLSTEQNAPIGNELTKVPKRISKEIAQPIKRIVDKRLRHNNPAQTELRFE